MFLHAFHPLRPDGCLAMALLLGGLPALAAPLATAAVRSDSQAQAWAAEGVVEAVRHSELAVQVAGRITRLTVKAGDAVRAGQLLAQVDASAATLNAQASSAQADAAKASLDDARKSYERQKLLLQKQFISAAAMDNAEAQYNTAKAQAAAQIAAAGAARSQTGFFNLTAPYAGVVADVPVHLGEMAMPGRALISVYDPTALRVTASVPQTRVAALASGQAVRIELPSLPANQRWVTASNVTVLPTADASTQSVQVWLTLPTPLNGMTPGMFARAWLPSGAATGDQRLYVPSQSVFRRAEMSAVYVINPQGKPLLRQVRIGAVQGSDIEVLAGVSVGEQVALDPLAAASTR